MIKTGTIFDLFINQEAIFLQKIKIPSILLGVRKSKN